LFASSPAAARAPFFRSYGTTGGGGGTVASFQVSRYGYGGGKQPAAATLAFTFSSPSEALAVDLGHGLQSGNHTNMREYHVDAGDETLSTRKDVPFFDFLGVGVSS
jgi:transcription factor MYB, plant